MNVRISDGEWKTMEVVWERGSASVREVHDDLADETGWAYTTVKTMLERLVDKGALEASRAGRSFVYRPLVSREEARSDAVHSLLDRAFDGASVPLLRFLVEEERLSAKDRKELRRLLGEEEKGSRR
ncbi:MAG: BlaI/MecI/CopY family transcriptional regulator [Planctomycetota bacterium]